MCWDLTHLGLLSADENSSEKDPCLVGGEAHDVVGLGLGWGRHFVW